jgi:hypothetical protein
MHGMAPGSAQPSGRGRQSPQKPAALCDCHVQLPSGSQEPAGIQQKFNNFNGKVTFFIPAGDAAR